MLQCVAVFRCCEPSQVSQRVLQSVAVFRCSEPSQVSCSVTQCDAVCRSELPCAAVYCSVLHSAGAVSRLKRDQVVTHEGSVSHI